MDCFVEVQDPHDAKKIVLTLNDRLLGTRHTQLCLSTVSELLENLFPHWNGKWRGAQPIVADLILTDGVHALPYISQEELRQLTTHMRFNKSHFAKKCPQRPFDSLLSILSKVRFMTRYNLMPSFHGMLLPPSPFANVTISSMLVWKL
jgi:hypothetical protein